MFNQAQIFHKYTSKDYNMEVWKEFDLGYDCNGLYVSNLGGVKAKSGDTRNIHDNGGGYMNIGIYDRDKKVTKKYYIHRLVAESFIGKPCNVKTQVNHKDGDKSNNCVSNLEWVSPKENIKHMHENGLNANRAKHGKCNTYCEETVGLAYSKVITGELGLAESAKMFGMPRTTLSSIVNKRSRSDVTDKVDTHISIGRFLSNLS